MVYSVKATAEFQVWLDSLSQAELDAFAIVIKLLQEKGPTLSRPYAATLKGSTYPNMKELRTPHKKHAALRAAFAFDPNRNAILLIGGDKHGKRGFYEKLIRDADALYATHLRKIQRRE